MEEGIKRVTRMGAGNIGEHIERITYASPIVVSDLRYALIIRYRNH